MYGGDHEEEILQPLGQTPKKVMFNGVSKILSTVADPQRVENSNRSGKSEPTVGREEQPQREERTHSG